MHTISAQTTSKASPAAVWALLAETATWSRWADFDEATLEQPGAPEPEGVGAVRRFRRGRWTTRERVVAFEPPSRFGYELLSGIPIKSYRADVTLEPAAEGGTTIRWESRFDGKLPIPGALMRRQLAPFIQATAEGLARAAEEAA